MKPVDNPPEDRERSPYTGWTRQHWEALADRKLLAVRRYASPGHALIDLPGPQSFSGRWSDGLEGFARTFLLAGFRLARTGKDDPHNLAEWYAAGLAAGADPTSTERWPTFEEKQQAKVECASIALALHETRPWIWDRLSERTQQHVIDWMARMIGSSMPQNNWIWFQNVTEAFLRTVGGPWSPEDIERNIALTEEWYAGDGWYSDGDHEQGGLRNFDYYSGWAMQFYPLLYCRMLDNLVDGGADPELLRTYRERLERFLADAQHLVGANGSPVLQGRSLTYRYAVLAPFWMGALFDATPLAPGRTRRLASGVLRHFVDAHCLDESDLQPIGWHGAFEPIRQVYSGPGSPYWSSKGFAGLLLPPDHPVWTETEAPLEIEERDVAVTIRPAGWVVSGTHSDGIVRLTHHRGDHTAATRFSDDDPFYARYAYSSHAAPNVVDPDAGAPFDSQVALVGSDRRPSQRRPYEPLLIDGRLAISRHRAHWGAGPAWFSRPSGDAEVGPWVTTAAVLNGPYEVRLVRVDDPRGDIGQPDPANPDLPRHPGPWRLRIGGWAIADDESAESELPDGTVLASVRRRDGLRSTVVGLRQLDTVGVATYPRANPLGTVSATPWAGTSAPVRAGEVYAALVVLAASDEMELVECAVDSFVDGAAVRIDWPDGTSDEFRLDPPTLA